MTYGNQPPPGEAKSRPRLVPRNEVSGKAGQREHRYHHYFVVHSRLLCRRDLRPPLAEKANPINHQPPPPHSLHESFDSHGPPHFGHCEPPICASRDAKNYAKGAWQSACKVFLVKVEF